MSELLALNDNIWWNAFITHCFRVRVMILTVLINLIPNLGGRETVSAFDIVWMNSLAFKFSVLKELIKRYVGNIGNVLFIQTVDTFGIWTMLTHPFHFLFSIFGVVVSTMKTSPTWAMIAASFLFFFVFF